MKYLHIHTLIWAFLCLLFLLFELMLFYLVNIISFIWSFEWVPYEEVFNRQECWRSRLNYVDHNPKETFLRHFRSQDFLTKDDE